MRITKRQLRRIIKETTLNERAGKIICPNCGHHNDAGVDKCSKCGHSRKEGNWKKVASEVKLSLNERGTGNPALQDKERAIMRAVVGFVDEYRLVMGLDPNDFGDDRRVRQAVQDVIAGVLGEDM